MGQKRLRLTDLQSGANFIPRHIGPRDGEITSMLDTVGASSLDDLLDKVVPAAIRTKSPPNLPEALSERNTLSDLRRMAGRNQVFTSMIGMGYYGSATPKGGAAPASGEPGLVHRLHALSGRGQPGASGSVAELSADGVRPHRPGTGQCLAA